MEGDMQPGTPFPATSSARAVRLIFEYRGDTVTLLSQQPVDVEMTADDLADTTHAGIFVDTRDRGGSILSRVIAPHAFARSIEVFPADGADHVHRVDVAEPRGAFTVIIPAPEAATHVTVVKVAPGADPRLRLFSGGVASPPAALHATDVASFPLAASS
jgi:hypothetical protein